jgi:transposase InsO family protein
VKFTFIDAEKATWPVRPMCRALGVSPSGFCAWKSRPESDRGREDRRLGVLTREAHERSGRRYGSPMIHAELREQGIHVSRKRIIRLMQAQGLRGRVRRAFVRTTDSEHGAAVAENILNRDFTASAPNQRWVGDVTYLRTREGWVYLAVLLDLFSRYIVGWAMSAVNDRRLALRALEMAVTHRRPAPGLIHHTDQGSPYASEDYQAELARLGIVCSMSRRGDCYDNAAMESWFGTFKTEVGEIFESTADAKRQTFSYIEPFYNQRRRHSTLGYLSPAAFERRWHQQQRTSSTETHSRSPACQSPPWTPLGTGSGGPPHTGLSP